jgi:hypothetical protein
MYDRDSSFSSLNIRSDIPKLAPNNRQKGTTEEYKAVAEDVLSYFGQYSTDEVGVLIQHVVSSSFPNFNGTSLKWSITIPGDDSTLASNAAASGGGSNEFKWKRLK